MKNPIEDALDVTRVKLYEQTKDMIAEERTEYIRTLTVPINEKYNITPVRLPIVRHQPQNRSVST
jgi:hypothetical protein